MFVIRTVVAVATALILNASGSIAQQPSAMTVDPDGTIHGATAAAPVSSFLSPEGKAAVAQKLIKEPSTAPMANADVVAIRARGEANARETLAAWLKIYPSEIEDTTIDGVHVLIVTPKGGIDRRNKARVLIGAHQGGFVYGGADSAKLQAVPMSGRGKIKVIAVDYRMGPEAKFPAASEDMEKVYRHVLKTTKPANVGLFGCSAGGTLIAQSLAWFQKKGLPTPGAASIMCSGAMETFWFGGDSNTTMGILNARANPPTPVDAPAFKGSGYFGGMDRKDPMITPGLYPEVLKKFPPTLIVTGTRDMAMSNAITTHAALLKAGADTELFVQEGMGHGFFAFIPGIPESMFAYDVLWNFLDKHLKR